MASDIVPHLQKSFPDVVFRHTDPTEQWWQGEQSPFLLDTVVGLDKVKVFTSIDVFENLEKRITPHDYDLLMDLAFLIKLKKIISFTLIGLPEKGDLQVATAQTKAIISSLSSI